MTDKDRPEGTQPDRYGTADHHPDKQRFEAQPAGPSPATDNPFANTNRTAEDRLKTVMALVPWHRRVLARLILWAEAVWPMLMPGLALIAFWLGLATLGVFEPYPGLGLLSLLGLLGLSGWFGFQTAQQTAYPTDSKILRRVERDNALEHRPFTSLTDDLATDDTPVARALWARHVARLRNTMPARLLLGPVQTHSARRDPFALRFAAALLAVVGFATAGVDAERRLLNAVSLSNLSLDLGSQTVTLDAWIAPPDYTSLPPVFLSRADQTGDSEEWAQDVLMAIPTGSTIFARVTAPNLSADRPPVITIGEETVAFEAADPGQFNLTYTLNLSDLTPPPSAEADTASDDDGRQRVSIAFHAGRADLGDWELLVTPDLAPSMVLSDSPSVSDDQLVEIPYAAIDDYGLTTISGRLRLMATVEGRTTPPVMDEIIAQAPEGQSLGDRMITTARQDLIAHPWAGLEIEIELTAQDALGQSATSETDTLILPMRNFVNPVARAIIDQRQILTLRPRTGPPEVAGELRNLAANPEAFNSDTVVIIGLAALATRLDINRTESSITTAQQLMWELALRLEDGQLGIVQRALERAASELADALEADSDATSEEIQELLDAYEEALQDFMNTLREEMMERLARGETFPEIPPGMEDQMLNPQEMAEMLEQLRDMAETGSREAAREMLSQLEQMMQNLQNAEVAEPNEQQQELRELGQRLQDLTREQQELMDDTFRGRPANPMEALRDLRERNQLPEGFEDLERGLGDAPSAEDRDNAAERSAERAQQNMARSLEQESLRLTLGELMLDLVEAVDELPENLGNAEQAMRGSTEALQNNQTARALQNMGEALEELEELQNNLQEQAEGMAGGPGGRPMLRFGTAPSQGRAPGTNQGFDPLGRNLDDQGRGSGSDVEVPSESDLQRARTILEELRRRAGEFERPEEELDYIERLLDRF